jgi:hypothetical protein
VKPPDESGFDQIQARETDKIPEPGLHQEMILHSREVAGKNPVGKV